MPSPDEVLIQQIEERGNIAGVTGLSFPSAA
jgi:hypothetical protein